METGDFYIQNTRDVRIRSIHAVLCLVNFKYNEDLGIGISAYKFWGFLHTDSGGFYIDSGDFYIKFCIWQFYIHRLAISTYSCVWGLLHIEAGDLCIQLCMEDFCKKWWGISPYRIWGFLIQYTMDVVCTGCVFLGLDVSV